MENLTSLLLTANPELTHHAFPFRGDTAPIEWAANICRQNARLGLNLQVMRSAFANAKEEDNSVVHVDTNRPQIVNQVLAKISQGVAGHASLQLLTVDSMTKACRFEPGREFYESTFLEALTNLYPLGHFAKMTLWFSASKHVYEAHSDMSDGFLFQLAGKKHVKVWPLPMGYFESDLFNHGDLDYLQTTDAKEFTLAAGDVLFIPGGAAHEVTVESESTSVSISFHVGGPYPILSLVRDLRGNGPESDFKLPDELTKTEKANITFFQPARYAITTEDQSMPVALRNALCEVIQSDKCSGEELARRLDQWWSEKLQNPTYHGWNPLKPTSS